MKHLFLIALVLSCFAGVDAQFDTETKAEARRERMDLIRQSKLSRAAATKADAARISPEAAARPASDRNLSGAEGSDYDRPPAMGPEAALSAIRR